MSTIKGAACCWTPSACILNMYELNLCKSIRVHIADLLDLLREYHENNNK